VCRTVPCTVYARGSPPPAALVHMDYDGCFRKIIYAHAHKDPEQGRERERKRVRKCVCVCGRERDETELIKKKTRSYLMLCGKVDGKLCPAARGVMNV